ncbi:MAG: 23S rRNA (uracil(1939)-C(5))-methyltransferase RlmD, partial [Gammaproteobacteria bacterium]|nr:23S rRNA (uracil(1939)-C(5))-methyltransferase RlmD [Gammaproteobacteria bacterium]
MNDKVVFVDGGLTGEEIKFRYTRRRGSFDEGSVIEVLQPSPERVEPRCPHFSICGGCSMQHLALAAQIRIKQERLLDSLARMGKVEPAEILPPLTGPGWGYRRKARVGVKYVQKKGRLLVGFREKRSSFVADISRCPVLHPAVGEKFRELNALISSLSVMQQIPQVEIAVSDVATVLVFRHLAPLTVEDQRRLEDFSMDHGFQICLQSGGPDSVRPLNPNQKCQLYYRLPEPGVDIHFRPLDFTQVNADINRKMVGAAIHYLDPRPTERILDLFCGLGNFTLSLARRAKWVVGVEGDSSLVQRARENGHVNGIENVEFYA